MSKKKQKLILIGNGMAGLRFLEKLCEKEYCPYEIMVFGSEPHAGYNRILLSPLLSGEQKLKDIITHSDEWYKENQIHFKKGKTIVDIDCNNKKIIDSDNNGYYYDKLVFATGSNPFIPPIPGNELSGVISYRTIKDVDAMLSASKTKSKAVVIGGGLLGLEAAYGLKMQGMDVTVLHLQSVLMENQLDATASKMLIASLESKGISIKTEASTKCFRGDGVVDSVKLSDGSILEADLVVMAVGIRPNIALAQSTGIDCERGIVVNNFLQTSETDIYALGECAQHQGVTYGLIAPLYEQAEVCASYLCGNGKVSYEGSVTATGLKVTGVHLFSAGQFVEDDGCKLIKIFDDKNNIYRKLVIKNNKLVGVLLYGDITGSLWYQELIQSKQDVDIIKEFIMFGPDFFSKNTSIDTPLIAA